LTKNKTKPNRALSRALKKATDRLVDSVFLITRSLTPAEQILFYDILAEFSKNKKQTISQKINKDKPHES